MKTTNNRTEENNQTTTAEELESLIRSQVVGIVRDLGDKKLTVGFAESCTGGLLSSFVTEISGVSQVFMGSVVSYDNKVKQKFLNVSAEALKINGAVSKEVAQQMADGAIKALDVSVAVSVTGIAGPTGGTEVKPVGTVFIAVAGLKSEGKVFECHFEGDRKMIQLQSSLKALNYLKEFINK